MPLIVDGYCTLGQERDTALSAGDLIRAMDQAGVTRAVIAPEDRDIAVLNASGNGRILAAAATAGGRLIPACTVNPWYGAASVQELGRAVRAGARMLVLAPALQGFVLSDEMADQVLAAAGDLGVPVYVHTGPHSAAAPSQLWLVAQRFPGVRFILGHGGSTDHAYEMPPLLRARLPNLWFELSFVRPWTMVAYGPIGDESRFLFGSGMPRNNLAFELAHFRTHWPLEQHPGTYGQNLLDLLGQNGGRQP